MNSALASRAPRSEIRFTQNKDRPLAEQRQEKGLLDGLDHPTKEAHRIGTVNDPVVVGQ